MAEAISGIDEASALGLLEQAVDRVAKLEVDQVSDGCLGDELVRLRRSIDRLEAEFSRRLQRFERLRGHVADGAASLVAWLRENCRLSLRGAATRAGVARSLASLPGAEELFNTGAIGFRHAAVLAQAVAEIGEEPVAQAGDILLEAARRLDPDRLRLLTKHLRPVWIRMARWIKPAVTMSGGAFTSAPSSMGCAWSMGCSTRRAAHCSALRWRRLCGPSPTISATQHNAVRMPWWSWPGGNYSPVISP